MDLALPRGSGFCFDFHPVVPVYFFFRKVVKWNFTEFRGQVLTITFSGCMCRKIHLPIVGICSPLLILHCSCSFPGAVHRQKGVSEQLHSLGLACSKLGDNSSFSFPSNLHILMSCSNSCLTCRLFPDGIVLT